MKKTYRVTWTESYDCAMEIEANSEEEAREIAYDRAMNGSCNEQYDKEFGESSDWQAEEVDD